MVLKSLLTLLGVLAVMSLPQTANALDQLPLPQAGVTPVQAQIMEFASADSYGTNTKTVVADTCARHLDKTVERNDEKIRAIKAYRQCRAEYALQQLAVWRWQGDIN